MKLHKSLRPHVRKHTSVRHMMIDIIVSLLLLMIVPIVQNGFRVVSLALLTALTCILCEVVFSLLCRTPIAITECSPVVTGFLIAMLMPVNVPVWVPIIAGAFAILVAKAPFGGTGRAPFNPAAAGVAFVTVCWPNLVFSYIDKAEAFALPFLRDCDVQAAASPAAILKEGLRPEITGPNLLLGMFPGPVGTTSVLVIVACALYIFIKKTANFDTSLCFAASAMLFAFLFPRIVGTRLDSVLFEMLSGSLVFCAVFMASEPSTSPRTSLGRCIYGALGGIITMLFRYFGAFEQGAVFAILLINTLSPALDRFCWRVTELGGGKAHGAE